MRRTGSYCGRHMQWFTSIVLLAFCQQRSHPPPPSLALCTCHIHLNIIHSVQSHRVRACFSATVCVCVSMMHLYKPRLLSGQFIQIQTIIVLDTLFSYTHINWPRPQWTTGVNIITNTLYVYNRIDDTDTDLLLACFRFKVNNTFSSLISSFCVCVCVCVIVVIIIVDVVVVRLLVLLLSPTTTTTTTKLPLLPLWNINTGNNKSKWTQIEIHTNINMQANEVEWTVWEGERRETVWNV